jgi:hypothetical protein
MIRIMSTFCVALMGFTILTLYHVSEQTRIARQDLAGTEKRIAAEQVQISVLEAQWQREAGPETIQRLAESSLGMSDRTTVQLASVTLLPRREEAPLGGEEVRAANAQMPAPQTPILKVSARSGM